jgi:hypothetical protein
MFILELCRALQSVKIPFCLVGGYAVALHGAVRGTIDVDISIAFEQEVFEKVELTLKGLGLEPRLPVRAKEVFQFREEYLRERNLIAWGFIDPRNPLRQVDVILTHSIVELNPQNIKLRGARIPVASLEGLISMKEQSSRPQDREDVLSLKAILKAKKS